MRFYNTLTGSIDEFNSINPGKVLMYSCGPTVYNFFHIGNARAFISFDLLRRYLEFRGYEVVFVQNFTDIDDKMINKANSEGTTVKELGDRYIEEYRKDAHGLNIRDASFHPRATETVPEIIEMVSDLVEKGFAYEAQGDVYFRVKRFDGYGKMSKQSLDDLESGARIDVNDIKEDPMDFALWKSSKEGEPSWDSPWGKGRPGWHIECSAMVKKYLGDTIDIHCGGVDLAFLHHENEIAQSECANGCALANFWMHNGHINVNNQKMAKSKGNFFTVRDVAAEYGYEPIRFFIVSSHYRSPLNYTAESIDAAKSSLERLYNCVGNLRFLAGKAEQKSLTDEEKNILSFTAKYKNSFIEEMDNDFNTANAVSVIFEFVKEINTTVAQGSFSAEFYASLEASFRELTDVLGLLYEQAGGDDDAEIEALIEERQNARKSRDFKKADEIRDKLKEMGIILEDTPQGVKWKRG